MTKSLKNLKWTSRFSTLSATDRILSRTHGGCNMTGYPGQFCSPNKPLCDRWPRGVDKVKSDGRGVFTAEGGQYFEKTFKDITLVPTTYIRSKLFRSLIPCFIITIISSASVTTNVDCSAGTSSTTSSWYLVTDILPTSLYTNENLLIVPTLCS